MKKASFALARQIAGAAAFVAAITYAYTAIVHVNPTTVALTFLVSVLIVSTHWGLTASLFTAVAATAAFNYFFLPPLRTFVISDTQNWVALLAFLATAVIASELSERARKQTEEAVTRRSEIERLYNFSQHLLTADNILALLNAVPQHVVDCFGVEAAAIYLPEKSDVYRAGAESFKIELEDLRGVIGRGEAILDTVRGVSFTPLRMGVTILGAVGVVGEVSRQTLDAMGALIGIAVQRAAAVEKLSRAEASREGEQLRSAILDSITHEFRTPLTSIKASVTSLMSPMQLGDEDRRELMTVINEETDRLNRLVGEAAEVAQLESHEFELTLRQHPILEPIQGAIEELKQVIAKHPLQIRDPEHATALFDSGRIKQVLIQLLENAAKYSEPEAPIVISAEDKGSNLMVSVADQGIGIDEAEQNFIFDKFYRGKNQRYRVQGTGMGLAIARAIVEAHGGNISLTSQPSHGSVFHFSLPRV